MSSSLSQTNTKKRKVDDERSEFLSTTQRQIEETVADIDTRKRQRAARIIETLRKIDNLVTELVADRADLSSENPGLLNTKERHKQVEAQFEALYPVAKVAYTVKRRNRDVFPLRGWGRGATAPLEERQKFAERDSKVIERFKEQKKDRVEACERLRAACQSNEAIATELERAELNSLKTRITDLLYGVDEPSPTRLELALPLLPHDFDN